MSQPTRGVRPGAADARVFRWTAWGVAATLLGIVVAVLWAKFGH